MRVRKMCELQYIQIQIKILIEKTLMYTENVDHYHFNGKYFFLMAMYKIILPKSGIRINLIRYMTQLK